MTMTTFQTILLTAIIAIWLVFSIVILIATIQNFLYDRRREKREQESTPAIEYRKERDKREAEQAARDLEYHEKRMKLLDK
jgi:cell division protein FtsL